MNVPDNEPVPLAASRIARGDHRSLRAAIIDAIREDLLSGLLPPGQSISIKELRARFGTGLSAIREALCQLVAEGMVIAEDQRGFRAAPISAADLADLTRTRIEIECFAIRDAIAHGDTEWEVTIVAEYHRLARQPSRDLTDTRRISPAYKDQHRRFHDALIAGSTSEWMKRFHATMHHHSERYRELIVSSHPHAHVRDILGEHRAIMEAVLARDAERATRLVTSHITDTAAILLELGVAQA
jgi:DNA-binding GntR family transcriptional regulator